MLLSTMITTIAMRRGMAAIRPSVSIQCRGMGIGRMIDMGGMPSGSTDNSKIRTVDASKNSKLKAVAFDFETLTTYGKEEVKDKKSTNDIKPTVSLQNSASITPDISRIEQVASLLKVELPGSTSKSSQSSNKPIEPPKFKLPNEDIRAKYAKKLQGGLAGIELAKHQVENALAKGDAPGHLTARKIAMTAGNANNNKWMAMSGTGVLLSYLSHRSIQLALLPNPTPKAESDDQLQSMNNLKKQLKDVLIDCIIDPAKVVIPTNRNQNQAHHVLLEQHLLKDLSSIHPNAILVVSDKDAYLKAAKELGMLTCRVQPPNARRGNISAHFNVPTLEQVQEVVNEINGISFNAILNR